MLGLRSMRARLADVLGRQAEAARRAEEVAEDAQRHTGEERDAHVSLHHAIKSVVQIVQDRASK